MWRTSRRQRRAHVAAFAPWVLLLLAAPVLAGCGAVHGSGTAGAKAESGATLIVFAASSLTDAFREIGARHEREHPGSRVVFQFAGSSQLRLQLEQGATADVFAPANLEQMDQARAAGLLGGPVRVFASNRLVVIHPVGNPAGIRSLGDLARDGVRLVTAPPEVPIGAYTREMLDRAQRDGAFGRDFKQRVLANVVSEEPNVRQAVAKVRLGEADAAVVYASDVTPDMRPHLGVVTIPDAYNISASYPLAVLGNAPHPEAARDFVERVLGPEGQQILEAWGFEPAAGARP
ncbi:MAG TPA: molybdate ABC transporter substrate-binding protein [Bacillota bacterium]